MSNRLPAAIETLYEVFARYPLPAHVDFCDHCVDPQQVAELHRTPLRQADAKQLGPLLGNAPYTWGDQAYVNHFLPRLLELVACGAMNRFSVSVSLSSCLVEPWRHGSDPERHAIEGFVRAWWEETMSTAPSPCRPQDVLDTLDGCAQDPQRFLEAWPVEAGEPAARQLATLVDDLLLAGVVVDCAFARAVNAWLFGPFPIGFLRQWLAATRDPGLARRLGATIEHLQLRRQVSAS